MVVQKKSLTDQRISILKYWFIVCSLTIIFQRFWESTYIWNFPYHPSLIPISMIRFITGALGGWLQWIALRQWLPNIRTWVPATSIGSLVSFVTIDFLAGLAFLSIDESNGLSNLLLVFSSISYLPAWLFPLLEGIILASCQWFVLRGKVKKALLWIPISGLGFVGGYVIEEGIVRLLLWASSILPYDFLILMTSDSIPTFSLLLAYSLSTGIFLAYSLSQKDGVEPT